MDWELDRMVGIWIFSSLINRSYLVLFKISQVSLTIPPFWIVWNIGFCRLVVLSLTDQWKTSLSLWLDFSSEAELSRTITWYSMSFLIYSSLPTETVDSWTMSYKWYLLLPDSTTGELTLGEPVVDRLLQLAMTMMLL